MDSNGEVVRFEFDKSKSLSNKLKHGVDFVDIQRLWLDPDAVALPARDQDEERWLVIGIVGGRHRSVVITHRGARIRLVSVRRSRDKEVRFYEGR